MLQTCDIASCSDEGIFFEASCAASLSCSSFVKEKLDDAKQERTIEQTYYEIPGAFLLDSLAMVSRQTVSLQTALEA